MTREELEALAETAETRTTGYLRAALADPAIKEAVHSRYVPGLLKGAAVANDPARPSPKDRKRA